MRARTIGTRYLKENGPLFYYKTGEHGEGVGSGVGWLSGEHIYV